MMGKHLATCSANVPSSHKSPVGFTSFFWTVLSPYLLWYRSLSRGTSIHHTRAHLQAHTHMHPELFSPDKWINRWTALLCMGWVLPFPHNGKEKVGATFNWVPLLPHSLLIWASYNTETKPWGSSLARPNSPWWAVVFVLIRLSFEWAHNDRHVTHNLSHLSFPSCCSSPLKIQQHEKTFFFQICTSISWAYQLRIRQPIVLHHQQNKVSLNKL